MVLPGHRAGSGQCLYRTGDIIHVEKDFGTCDLIIVAARIGDRRMAAEFFRQCPGLIGLAGQPVERCSINSGIRITGFFEHILVGSGGGEESAGASFLRRDGTVWTTDKDGIILALLAAEITAVTGLSPRWAR